MTRKVSLRIGDFFPVSNSALMLSVKAHKHPLNHFIRKYPKYSVPSWDGSWGGILSD